MPACIHVNAIPKPCHAVKILVTTRHKTRHSYHCIYFLKLEQGSAFPQSEGDQMTPHLLNFVHVAVRKRFEGAQTYGLARIHTKKNTYVEVQNRMSTRPYKSCTWLCIL